MSVQPRIIEKSHADVGTVRMLADLNRKVAKLMANANAIAPGAVGSGQLAAGSVGTTQIANGAVNTAEIAAGAITTTTIAAGAVTATQISVSNLSAISAALGTITSGTVTGATVQTTTGTSSKVIMDSAGIRAYDAASNNLFNVATTGAVTITNAALTMASSPNPGTGARVTLDATGLKAYNASNVNLVKVDATTGLITATGVITAQTGSTLPTAGLTGSLPGGANKITNSNWTDGANNFSTTDWQIVACTLTSAGSAVPPVFGSQAALLTSTGVNSYIQVNTHGEPNLRVLPGLNYTSSLYVYPGNNVRNLQLGVSWYNAAGTYLSQTYSAIFTPAVGAWTRLRFTMTPPAGATTCTPFFIIPNSASGDYWYLNGFQFEMGDQASAYMPRPDEILYNSINANMIQVNTITADRMNVANLAAINANLGNIISGTVTGATVQTSTGASSKVIMDSAGLRGYDASSNILFNLSTTGALAVTNASMTFASGPNPGTGARMTLDGTGLHAYNPSNQSLVSIDATTGLITATGILTANIGSAIPTSTVTGYMPGSANRYSNSAFQDGQGAFQSTGWLAFGDSFTDGGTTVPPLYGARNAKIISAGETPPAAPTAAKVTAVPGNLGVGTYLYYVTETNASGEGKASPATSITTTASSGGGQQQTVVTLPIGPAGTTARTVYRTTVGGAQGTEKFVATIADNTTTSYTDNIADASLGAGTPPTAPPAGVPNPPVAPTVVLAGPGGNLGVGTYMYEVTFYTASGETNGSAEVSVTTTTNFQTVQVGIPTGPTGTVGRKIYRTAVGGVSGSEKLLTTIADNTTTVYTDTIADASLGALVPTVSTITAQVYVQTTTTTDPKRRVIPGASYTFSHYQYPVTNARGAAIIAQWYDINGTLLSSTTSATQTPTLNAWNRIVYTATAPANAAYARGIHYISYVGSPGNETTYVSGFQMEEGDRVSAYAPSPDEILSNAVSAGQMNVSSLDAITATMGSLTSGTITGATIQTAAGGSNPRAILGPNPLATSTQGMWVVDTSGNNAIGLDGTNGIRIRSHGTVAGAGHLYWFAPASNFNGQILGNAYSYDQGSSSGFTYIGAYQSGDVVGSNANVVYTSKGAGGNEVGVVLTALGGFNQVVYNSAGRSNFIQAGDPSSGTVPLMFRLWGPYLRQFTGWTGPGNNTFTLTGGFNIANGQYVVMASLENGAYMDHCSWCVTASGNGTMSFSVYMSTANTASGWFKCFILTHGGTSTG